MKVAVVEKWPPYGGTCLNIGCIPSKALLDATELFEEAGHNFSHLGIDIPAPQVNLAQMMVHKDETVSANVNGVSFLFKKNKITSFQGTGSLAGKGKVLVTPDKGGNPPTIEIDEERIVTSTGALSLGTVPKHKQKNNANKIGLERGSVWARLGAKVT